MIKYIYYWNLTMNKLIQFSFSFRLMLGMFTLGFFLLFGMFYYTYKKNKLLIIEHMKEQERLNLDYITKNIMLDIQQLEQENKFLSKLSVMNDLVANDMDKRIIQLLEVKKKTLKLPVNFQIFNIKGEKICATTQKRINRDKDIFFRETIPASFNPQLTLGYIEIIFPISAFNLYLEKRPYFSLSLNQEDNFEKFENYLFYFNKTIHLKGNSYLKIHVAVPYESIQYQLNVLRNNLILIGIIALLLLYLFAYILSKKMSQPLLELSKLMQDVSNGNNYHLRSNFQRNDELGVLSQSFNNLLSIIEKNITHIEQESAYRMRQFTNLVESFSKISQEDNYESLNKSLAQIKLLSHIENNDKFDSSIDTLVALQYERIALQENQVKLLEKATELAESRSDFLTQISHEFKTPLNSIIGFSQFIDYEKLLPPNYQRLIQNIEKSGKHLLQLVNNVLEVAQKDNIQTPLKLDFFHISELIKEVCELLEPQAHKSNIIILLENNDEVNRILSDKRMIKQVLINLIGNAIKFSNHKDIKVYMQKEKGKLSIHIIDYGIGMNQESIRNLFVPFVRLTNAYGIKGTGLGLALAQTYMRKLGGSIIAKSEGIYNGSEFIIKVNI